MQQTSCSSRSLEPFSSCYDPTQPSLPVSLPFLVMLCSHNLQFLPTSSPLLGMRTAVFSSDPVNGTPLHVSLHSRRRSGQPSSGRLFYALLHYHFRRARVQTSCRTRRQWPIFGASRELCSLQPSALCSFPSFCITRRRSHGLNGLDVDLGTSTYTGASNFQAGRPSTFWHFRFFFCHSPLTVLF